MNDFEDIERESKAVDATTAILSLLIDKHPDGIKNEDIGTVFDQIQKLIRHYEYIPKKKSLWQRIFGDNDA